MPGVQESLHKTLVDLQPTLEQTRIFGKKALDTLECSILIEDGAASETQEVLAASEVELPADVVNQVLEDLNVQREPFNITEITFV